MNRRTLAALIAEIGFAEILLRSIITTVLIHYAAVPYALLTGATK